MEAARKLIVYIANEVPSELVRMLPMFQEKIIFSLMVYRKKGILKKSPDCDISECDNSPDVVPDRPPGMGFGRLPRMVPDRRHNIVPDRPPSILPDKSAGTVPDKYPITV